MALAAVGSLGTGNITSSNGAIAFASINTANIGDVLIAVVSKDNTSTITGSSSDVAYFHDSPGNTWTKASEYTYSPGGVAGDGTTVAVFFTNATHAITAFSSTFTTGFTSTVVSAAATVYRFTATGTVRALTSSTQNTTISSSSGFGSLTISGLTATSANRLFIRAIGVETVNKNLVVTAGWTAFTASQANTGTDNTSQSAFGEFLLSTATSNTSNPTMTQISGGAPSSVDSASAFIVLEESTPLTGSSETASQGAVTPSYNIALTSNTVTALINAPTYRLIVANSSPAGDQMGFGGGDYATVNWAGSDFANGTASTAIIVGVMGMF